MKGQNDNLGRLRKAALFMIGALVLTACSSSDDPQTDTDSPAIVAEMMYHATSVPVSTDCPAGGIYVDIGTDTNRNGILDTNEIKRTDQICNGRNGQDGRDSLIDVMDEPAGENCAAGGYKLRVATDADHNGKLDDDEPNLQVKYLCHGLDGQDGDDGLTSLIASEAIPFGNSDCPAGGVRIRSGVDRNRDGVLAIPEEVLSTQYVCSGEKGEQGLDGMTSLVRTTVIRDTEVCLDGGVRLEYGLDDNFDGVLSDEEVDNFQNVCNGVNGQHGTDGQNALVKTVAVAPGTECEAGGTRIEYGRDANNDGVLGSTEVEGNTLLCNGQNGTDGTNGVDGVSTLVQLAELSEGSAECANGGTQIVYGADTDRDGTLAEAEIQGRQNVCHGADGRDGINGVDGQNGSDALVRTERFTSSPNCPAGGVTISHGQDLDNNQVLDASEVLGSTEICNGANGTDGQDGADGQNGLNVVTVTETVMSGADGCSAGGMKVKFGLDANRNGNLDAGEETSSQVLCNGRDGTDGADGFNTVITTAPLDDPEICQGGGLWIYSGLDLNRNGQLDMDQESYSTAHVCNGYVPSGVACYLQSYSNGSRYLQCGDDQPVLVEEGIDFVETTVETIDGGYRIRDSWDTAGGTSDAEFRSHRNPHFVFDINSDGTVNYSISSGASGRVYILDQLGNVIAGSGAGSNSVALSAGRYTAIAATTLDAYGSFSLDLTGDITKPQKVAASKIWIPTRWEKGIRYSGSDPSAASIRNPWFRFTVDRHDYVDFDVDNNQSITALVLNADGTLVGNFSLKHWVMELPAGTYELAVTSNAMGENGRVTLVGPVAGFTQINPETTVKTGTLPYAAGANFASYRNDHYRFTLDEETRFDLLYSNTGSSSRNYVELRRDGYPTDVLIKDNLNETSAGGRVLQAGSYELVVGVNNTVDSNVDYTLKLFGLNVPVTKVAAQEHVVSGTWVAGGESWFEYKITLSERSALDLLVLDSSSTHPVYQILDDTGLERVPATSFEGNVNQTVNHLVTPELPAGTYTLRVKSANANGGRFDLNVVGLISGFVDLN